MGKRGPKREPTRTLKLRGSWKAKDRSDIEVTPAYSEPPAWLDDVAKEHWHDVVAKIAKIGIISDFDWPLLADLCDSYSRKERYRTMSDNPLMKTGVKIKKA
jgi:phage terminase small subunit